MARLATVLLPARCTCLLVLVGTALALGGMLRYQLVLPAQRRCHFAAPLQRLRCP